MRKELGGGRALGAVPIAADSPFLTDFLESHLADIRRSQPGFAGAAPGDFALVLTRDGMPAGALVGRPADAGTLEITLDYVMAAYRDSRIGAWIFGEGSKALRDSGFKRVVTTPTTEIHRSYLQGVGFRVEGAQMVRELG